MDEITFADWIIVKNINWKFWDFQKLSVKIEDFKKFLDDFGENGRCNLVLKKGKSWKHYIQLDNWKPDPNYNKSNIESDEEFESKVKSENEDKWKEQIQEEVSIEDIPF